MTQAMFEFRVTGIYDDFACGGIDLVAADAGLQHGSARLDGLKHGRKGTPNAFRRVTLSRPAHVPHALQVGAVAFLFHTQVNMHELPGLPPDIRLRLAMS